MGGTSQKQSSLPVCDYRCQTETPDVYQCRHTQVRVPDGIVTEEVCRNCTVYSIQCESPREPLRQGVALPAWYRRAWNLTAALAAFVADGLTTVSPEQYETRLQICDECPQRKSNLCRRCGCNLSVKAKGRAFRCPLDKWPDV